MYLWSMSNLQGNIQRLPPRGNEAADEGRDPEEGGGREETIRRMRVHNQELLCGNNQQIYRS